MPPNPFSHQKLIKSSSLGGYFHQKLPSKAPLPTARCQPGLFDHGSGAVNRFLNTAPKKKGIFGLDGGLARSTTILRKYEQLNLELGMCGF